MKKILISIFSIVVLIGITSSNSYSQTGFNPVLEASTGTWCQWCPCGHTIAANILVNYPNTVVLEYHGGGGGDPFQNFNGNSILGLLSNPFWPAGTVDRTRPMSDRGAWNNWVVIDYNTVQPGVSISISKSYNSGTRLLSGTVTFVALQNLTGDYYWDLTITENNVIYFQQGNASCPGGSNYNHMHIVRDKVYGALGEIINSGGVWNIGQQYVKTLNYTVSNSWADNNIDFNVFAYKSGSPLAGNAPVAQSKKEQLILTGVENQNSGIPKEYSLSQNYPNPFNPTTNIKFSIPKDGDVSFKIYDMVGKLVATYLDGFVKAGTYNADVDGSNWASGVYFYKLTADGFTETKKMSLVK